MSDIFLSYATEDRARTRILVQGLESRGWSVWWDRTIRPGQTFDSVIESALADSRCIVVLWSTVSVTSDWVKTEAEEARRRRILVPVLIDDVIVPFEFRRIQAARLVGWTGDQAEEEFGKLVHAIAEKMEQPPPPPPQVVQPPARARSRWRRPALLGSGVSAAIALAIAAYLSIPYQPVVVGVMDFRGRGNTQPWMCASTRDSLNTVLSKAGRLRVYSSQAIDLLHEKRGLTDLEAARELGITKMVSGTLTEGAQNLVLEVQVVDIKSGGMLEYAEELRGNEAQLLEMQNRAALAVLKTLAIYVTQEEASRLVANRKNDQLEAYKLLTESLGEAVEEKERPSGAPPKPEAPNAFWRLDWPAAAHAEDGAEQRAVQQLLERYRTALESKSVDQIAAVYVDMSPGMREALARYFATADDLKVRFSNFDILIEGNQAVATFTRNDEFKDARSGRDMQLEVRVSSMVAKQDGGWRIRGLKKPS